MSAVLTSVPWQDKRLEAAYDALDDALAETHPELGEHDTIKRAMGAIEDADIALQRLAKLYRGDTTQGNSRAVAGDSSIATLPEFGADPALAVPAKPVSRLGASRCDPGESDGPGCGPNFVPENGCRECFHCGRMLHAECTAYWGER